ncbi:hypothetical protein ACFX2G_003890 [Malus domestica]
MVSDLIDPVSNSWKHDLILAGFNQEDVTPILSIPLSQSGCEDRWVWHHTTNGEYIVKSGYGMAIKLMENAALGRKGRGGPSEVSKHHLIWNKVWSLQVPIRSKFSFGAAVTMPWR